MNANQLEKRGVDFVSGRIESTTSSGYFPGTAPITVKVTAERLTGRLLGGQIVGDSGAGKPVDTLATALTAQVTLADIEFLDLSYALPFSPVWDPVQIAARIAGQRVHPA